jgi:hypothetical protein
MWEMANGKIRDNFGENYIRYGNVDIGESLYREFKKAVAIGFFKTG